MYNPVLRTDAVRDTEVLLKLKVNQQVPGEAGVMFPVVRIINLRHRYENVPLAQTMKFSPPQGGLFHVLRKIIG
ncbi:hypothetical protein D3C75_1352450 [compost metagenome]